MRNSPRRHQQSDLELLDEVLGTLRQDCRLTWAEVEARDSATHRAMGRLRQAWAGGEMRQITLGLATHFRSTPAPAGGAVRAIADRPETREAGDA